MACAVSLILHPGDWPLAEKKMEVGMFLDRLLPYPSLPPEPEHPTWAC